MALKEIFVETSSSIKEVSLNNKLLNSKEMKTKIADLSNRFNSKMFPEELKDKTRIESHFPIKNNIEKSLSTSNGIKKLIELHPEKSELWGKKMNSINTLRDIEASPIEKRFALNNLSQLKGQLMEYSVKDEFKKAGFTVESQQREVVGQFGKTKPDIIAINNTDKPIYIFDSYRVLPKEQISVECKCGGKNYLSDEFKNHLPNQLSGLEGHKFLTTTSDIKYVDSSLVKNVTEKYDASLIKLDINVFDIEKSIKDIS